jgi:putative ABC transport system substrate-binding protein
MIRRRQFITLLGGAAAAWPIAARAQQAAVPVIGSLQAILAAEGAGRMAAFRSGLGETGFVDGRNVAIEYRWSDGQSDKLSALADDLIRRKVAVLVVGGTDVATQTAMSATKTIPIVFSTASDPVDAGFVPSIARPGGNVTGVTALAAETSEKSLDLLHELVARVTKVALLVNPNNPRLTQDFIESQAAAHRLGLDTLVFQAGSSDEIGSAIAAAAQQKVGAISIANDGYLGSRSQQIAFFALRHGLPTISGSGRQFAEAGLLMSYGSNLIDSYRFIGGYVGRILKGEKPADLPVVQPTKFELVINLTAAKALGLTVPQSILLRADEVIE